MRIYIVFLIIIFIVCNRVAWSQSKRALVIGLGQQADTSWAKINGDKDVQYVKEMLTWCGYKDIRTLVNKQATKAKIVAAFNRLATTCTCGDIVYIHFSGHGQQVRDMDCDEKDLKDEAWIPYDALQKRGKKDKGEKHLIDDEIGILLSKIKDKIGEKGKILVVVDACHSGDSSRGEIVCRGANKQTGSDGVFYIPGKRQAKREKVKERWLTLSACGENQFCQEKSSPKVGLLTYALFCQSKSGNVEMKDIRRFVAQNKKEPPQDPVLTGETTKYNLSDFLK